MSVSASNNKKAVTPVVDEPEPFAASEDPWKGLVSSTDLEDIFFKFFCFTFSARLARRVVADVPSM